MRPERVGAVVNPHADGGSPAAPYATLADCFPGAEADERIMTDPTTCRSQPANRPPWRTCSW
jgi:hypothetical protein